jgi:hypothetical protein
LAKNVFFGKSPGVSAFSRSASSIVGLVPRDPAVWMSRSICRTAASITSGAAWPMFRTAMPVEKSISRLPSTSSMIAPEARALTIGWIAGNADVMASVAPRHPLLGLRSGDLGQDLAFLWDVQRAPPRSAAALT